MTTNTERPTLAGAAHALRLMVSPPAFEARKPTYPAVPYRATDPSRGTPPRTDIYIPEGDGPHPSVVLIHGGGFVVGSREMKPAVYLATRLVEAGYVVCVPSYRKIFRGGRLDAMVDDISSAFAWWLDRRTDYGASTEHCSLLAKSAGVAIAMLAAEGFPEESFDRFISIFGIYDLSPTPGLLGGLMPRFLVGSSEPQIAFSRSPMGRPPLPFPITLLHGTEDRLAPYEQAERFLAQRQQQGADIDLITYAGEEHSWFSDARRPVCEQSMADILGLLAS